MGSIGIILAAGKGTRMKSDLPKPVVSLKNKPLAKYIIESFNDANVGEIALVVGYKSDVVKSILGDEYIYIEQKEQKGTGHAIMQVEGVLDWHKKDILIFVGDSPLISGQTVNRLLLHHKNTQADCTFLTSDFHMELPYGRVIRDGNGKLIKCVEEKNATESELKIREMVSSHFVFKGDKLFKHIHDIKPDPDNDEYYLTEILEIFINNGLKVETVKIDNFQELVGLNTPEDLAWAEKYLQNKKLESL